MSDLEQRLTSIFRATFGDEGLRPEMTADDVTGWDSISHIRLVLRHRGRVRHQAEHEGPRGPRRRRPAERTIGRHLGVAAG